LDKSNVQYGGLEGQQKNICISPQNQADMDIEICDRFLTNWSQYKALLGMDTTTLPLLEVHLQEIT